MPKATVKDAAQLLDRSRDTILEYERRGLLTVERTVGGIRLFEVAQLKALKVTLDSKQAPPPPRQR